MVITKEETKASRPSISCASTPPIRATVTAPPIRSRCRATSISKTARCFIQIAAPPPEIGLHLHLIGRGLREFRGRTRACTGRRIRGLLPLRSALRPVPPRNSSNMARLDEQFVQVQRTELARPGEEVRFALDLYGAFPVKRLFRVVLTVFCSERERPFFVPSPAIRSPERAEGVKGPKR